jgi:hypothetical protein
MSWAGIAANQCVSLNNLQNAVDTSVFTLKNTIPAGLKQITKAEAGFYVNINQGFAPYAAKSSNQLVVKSNLVACTTLPYSYTLYYNYNDGPFFYAGYETSGAACAATTPTITLYSSSSTISVGAALYTDPCGYDAFHGVSYIGFYPYFKIGSDYITFENFSVEFTGLGNVIRSVGSCVPVTFTEYRAYGYDEFLRQDACPLNNLTGSPQTVYAETSNPFAVTQFYNTPDTNDPWDNLPGDGYAVSFSTAADTATRYAAFGTTTGAINSVIAC